MAKLSIKQLRDFPSVEEILQDPKIKPAIESMPRPIIVSVIREVIDSQKLELKKKEILFVDLMHEIINKLNFWKRKEISSVVNATGIVVHTNLGRAPLSEILFDEIKKHVTGYGNIEFDNQTGKRGKRGEACEKYLAALAKSESAAVVNNCASALFLILNTFANRKNVILSRGELVQIGGGFRIPGILKKSGAKLSEIGTTNITIRDDYENAIDSKTGLILKVHQSNFKQAGFVEETSIQELVLLGKEHKLPVVNDLGSGVFISTKEILGYNEPTVQQSVKQGANITCFSGDKMLGGCQAGLIVGQKEYIDKIKKNPLFRTMRVDKIVYSILEKLLTIYLNDNYKTDVKLWSILSTPESLLYKRGKEILKSLSNPEGLAVEASKAFVGGGALPESEIPSVAITFNDKFNPNKLLRKFRELATPVIGRIEDGRFMIDLKAVDESELSYLANAIKKIIE
ncbi:MAG: L-seryl-tRNA(Sec) selenium transferase [candidate division Zixibacteria bacterium]|nr:L-seryl-tRNA(Sec) selenium transferase [candidate division Zixibacteria bacterium]